MYGSGLRVLEAARLRVKDIDFASREITVRDGKGRKDRVTLLPQKLVGPPKQQLRWAKQLHDRDLKRGAGYVELPYALRRKYPSAARSGPGNGSFPPPEFTWTGKPVSEGATTCTNPWSRSWSCFAHSNNN